MLDPLFLTVLLAVTLAAGYKFWQSALDSRELANRIAQETCARAAMQFLDGTVSFSGMRLARNANGQRRWLRTYTFDYTGDGFAREQGFIVISGLRLQSVGLAGAAS